MKQRVHAGPPGGSGSGQSAVIAVHLAQLVEDAVAKLGAIVGLQDAWRHRILPEEIHLEGEGKEDAQKSWMACCSLPESPPPAPS